MPGDSSDSLRALHRHARRTIAATALAALGWIAIGCHSETTGPCTADKLAFSLQPTATNAGSPFSVTVQALDASGGVRTCFTGNVTLSLQTAPTGASLSGTASVPAVSGVANFTGLSLTKSGSFSLRAASTAATNPATSNAFAIIAGPATALAFTTQPANALAGAAITVQVTARDQYGNTSDAYTGAVQIGIGTNPGSGTLTGAAPANAVAGVVNFTTLSIDKVGNNYTLTASAVAGAPPSDAASTTFNITPGPTTKLAFTVQPTDASAGSPIPAIEVSGEDSHGNVNPTFAGTVAIAIGTNPGTSTLSGTTSKAAANGKVTFSDLSLNKPGTGYTLTASVTGGGLTGATSNQFNVSIGPLAKLIFSTQPTTVAAGAVIAPSVKITGQDAGGNTVTTFTGNVTVSFGNNAGNGTLGGILTQPAASGTATFNDLTIDKIGTGYTLNASSGGVPTVTSNQFNVTPASAAKLAFQVQPVSTDAGKAIAPAVKVRALDQFDNLDTTFVSNVTLSIATNANAGTLSGTKTVAAVAGVATFTNLSIDSAGAGYTLNATAPSVTDALSSTFDIRPGHATHLAFRAQPTNVTAGLGIAPTVQVTALDSMGNVDTTYIATVAMGITTGSGTSGAHLRGAVSVPASAGLAGFPGISLDSAGTGYTLRATSGTLTAATSLTFAVRPGAATKLGFLAQPLTTAAGAPITPSVKVAARDSLGNTDTTYTTNVTIAIGTNPPGNAVLTGGGPVAAVAGVATFTASIDKVGVGYTLTATSGTLTGATSQTFDIIANSATHLVFFVDPTNAVAGAAISPAVVVHALDASNNIATDFTAGITLSITPNTGDPTGTLTGKVLLNAVAGVATFDSLVIKKTGDAYTLDAAAGGLTGGTSGTFNITPAVATHLNFAAQPSSDTAGKVIAPPVVVQALDAFGNVDTAYTANIGISIGTNPPGSNGTLTGTTPIPATNGQASFSDLSIDKSGVGYTLHATSTGIRDTTSLPFTISAAALAKLAFTVNPHDTAAGAVIQPDVVVQGQDVFGNKVTSFAGDVLLAFQTNAGGGTLGGTLTRTASGGDATFNDLFINKAGQGYTLKASTTGATDGVSSAFNITAGGATKLAFLEQPAGTTTAHLSISPPIKVTAQDALGNTDSTFAGSVTMSLGANPAGGALAGTLVITAVNGTATFSNLFIDKAGTGYALQADPTAGGLTFATSNTFTIQAAAATKLGFTVDPVTTPAGVAIPEVHIDGQDPYGNTDSSFVGNVGVAITGGTGTTGALLTGGAAVAAVKGVAKFANLKIDSAGANYTLTASTSGGTTLTPAPSAAFNITPGQAQQLVFGVQPHDTAAGAVITPNVTVVAKDAIGNIDTSYAMQVTVNLLNAGAAVPANNVVVASHGIATFSNLSVAQAGTGYQLQGVDGTLTSGASNAFAISPAAPDHLTFIQGPTNTPVGASITPAIQVGIQDLFGNIVTGFTGNVTVAIGTNPGGGSLSGLANRAAIAGVATFPSLSINAAGNGYTLNAGASGLATLPSGQFNITASTGSQLFFSGQPATTTAGTAFPTMTVEIRDAAGQLVSSPNVDVTLAIKPGTGTAGATLSPTDPITVTSSGGMATFTGVSIDKAGSSYQLIATATGLDTATSKFISIRPGAATQLVFTVPPSNAIAGANIAPAVEVAAEDNFGNADTSFHSNVTIAIGTNPPGTGNLSGTAIVAPVKGIASFANLNIDTQGSGYTLTADGGGLPQAISGAFNITAALGNHLTFSVPPATTTAGQPIASGALAVQVLDGSNALATGFVGSVTLSITANTGTSGATLGGTVTQPVVSGTATFNNVNIDRSGSGYKLSAVATGAAGVTSGTFAINPGAATHVVFTQDPQTVVAGTTIPTVTVEARDDFGNTDGNYVGSIHVRIATNPGGGTLSGDTAITAVAGVANFGNLSINKSGTGYDLSATSGGLIGDISQAFSINPGTATHLVFTVAPSSAVHDVAIAPAIRVAAYDQFDNVATGFGNDISLAIATGTAGASITGVITRTPGTNLAGPGEARFDGLSINLLGTYTLVATASGVTQITSTTFNITN
jgi:hypothetical protein